MDLIPLFRKRGLKPLNVAQDSSGIALFMVLASVSLLAVLVTEFVYIAQVSQMIAYGGLDQAKAHYIAKSGLKLSLLRLNAYVQAKKLLDSAAKAQLQTGIPPSAVEQIWSFPFSYPIPTNIPGMDSSTKAMIEQFHKDTGIDGKFFASIQSESSKFNLNLLLAHLAPNPNQTPTPNPNQTPTPNQTPEVAFDTNAAHQGLHTFLTNLITQKSEIDADFAQNYRDFRVEDLVDVIAAWADRTYDRRTPNNQDKVAIKHAPFYTVSELQMLPLMDDELYNLFAPHFSANSSAEINVNTLQEGTLKALVPNMTKDEVSQFFKFRDSPDQDNLFTKPEAFYDYLSKNVAVYRNPDTLNNFKNDLKKRNLELVTHQGQFKITVRAESGTATKTIEAWVTLGSGGPPGQPNPPPPSGPGPNSNQPAGGNSNGMKITFLKIY